MSIPVKREVKVLSLQDILQKNGLIKKVHKNIFDDDDDVEYLPNLTLPALNDLNLPQEILSRLFIHQKEGVSWLYSCYLNSSGALLADDMGLGKTFQTITFMCALMRMNKIRNVLILCPVSVLANWQSEVVKHLIPYTQDCVVDVISADWSKKRRLKALYDTFASSSKSTRKQIIISSYQLVSNMAAEFSDAGVFDYVILDEGHNIKNANTKTSKSMHQLRSHHRLLITGTPIQNNLDELYTLMDWATNGKLLGTRPRFLTQFINPILAGQNPKADTQAKLQSQESAMELKRLIHPVFLQRKKLLVNAMETEMKLTNKSEVTVWIPLSTTQRQLYQEFLGQRPSSSNSITHRRGGCLIETVTHLKTICRHPYLLEASDVLKKIAAEKERAKYGANANPKPTSTARNVVTVLDSDDFDDDEIFGFDDEFNVSKHQSNRKNTTKYMGDLSDGEFDDEDDANLCESLGRLKLTQSRQESLQQQFQPERHIKSTSSLFDLIGRKCSSDDLCAGSIKLRVLLQLCRRLHRAGHRTLVFSQSRLMIDIIQSALNEKGLFSVRIDGTVTGSARQGIIDKFNSGASSNAHRQQASNTNDDEENENDEEERIYSDILNPTICLLTTKACGYGITLTGADRVIIYDPSWNPAEDRQAVDRAFRIGQTRDVFVYRFIMASTVEEKMYEKQVFKDGVRILTEKGSSSSYFSSQETSELFNLGPPDSSEVYDRLPESFKFTSIPDVRGQLSRVIGYSRHDVLYDESGPKPDSSATTATSTATSTNGHSKQRSKVATLVDVSEDSTGSEAYTRNGLRRLSHFSVAEESIEDDHDVDLIMNEVQLVDVRSKRRTRIKRRSTIEDVDIEDISNEFESKMNLLSSSPRLATTNGHRNVFVIDSDSDCDLDCEYLPNTIKSTRRVNISIAESETNVQTPIQANLNQEKKYIAKFSNHLGDTNPLRPGEYSNWDDDDYALSSTQPSPPPQQPKLQQQPQLLQEHKPVADEDYESPSSLYLKVTAVIGYIANVTRLSFLSPLSGGSAGAITQSPIKSLSQIQGLLQQDYEKRRIDDDYNDTDNDRQSSLTRELFIESEEVPISATDHSVLHNDNDTNPDMKEDTSVAGFNSVTTVPLSATDLEAESEAAASAVALWDTSIVYSRDLDLVESDESSQESIATTIKHISTTDSVAHDSVSVSVSEAHTPGSQVTRYSVSACDTDNDFPLLGQSGALVELRRTQQAIVSRESLIHNTIDLCSPVFKSSQWTQLPSPTPTKSPMSLSMKSPLTPLQQHTPQTRRKVLASSGMKTANASGDENDISNIENRTPCVNQNSNIKISAVSTAMKDKAIDISTPLTYSHCKYKDGSFAKKYLVKPQLASITRTPQSFRPSQPLPTPQSFLERLFTPSTASSCQSNGNANKSTEISGNRRKSSQSSQNDSKLRNKQSATKDGAKDYNDVVIDTIDPMFWL